MFLLLPTACAATLNSLPEISGRLSKLRMGLTSEQGLSAKYRDPFSKGLSNITYDIIYIYSIVHIYIYMYIHFFKSFQYIHIVCNVGLMYDVWQAWGQHKTGSYQSYVAVSVHSGSFKVSQPWG